jgi:hypothetical protein
MIIASVLFLTLLDSSAAFAQAAESENRNLNDQFRELRDKAETYNEYRVIKGSSLNSFWKSVQDSLQSYRTGLESRAATISELNTQLNDLRQRANQLEEELNLSRSRENALPFLGFPPPQACLQYGRLEPDLRIGRGGHRHVGPLHSAWPQCRPGSRRSATAGNGTRGIQKKGPGEASQTGPRTTDGTQPGGGTQRPPGRESQKEPERKLINLPAVEPPVTRSTTSSAAGTWIEGKWNKLPEATGH